MNRLKDRKARQLKTKSIIDGTTELLNEGLNPIESPNKNPDTITNNLSDVTPDTLLSIAFSMALAVRKKEISKGEYDNLASTVTVLLTCPNVYQMKCGDLKWKNVVSILDDFDKYKLEKSHDNTYSNNSYNTVLKHLQMLFKKLHKNDAIEQNFINKDFFPKKQHLAKVRQTFSLDERVRVDEYLRKTYYPFYRYFRIFFASGSRSTELFKLKCSDVNLEKREFTLVIIKGQKMERVTKIIEMNVLPFWKEILQGSKPNHFVFSAGLSPGAEPKNPRDLVIQFYNRNVKQKLNINIDFYSLKHLHSNAVLALTV